MRMPRFQLSSAVSDTFVCHGVQSISAPIFYPVLRYKHSTWSRVCQNMNIESSGISRAPGDHPLGTTLLSIQLSIKRKQFAIECLLKILVKKDFPKRPCGIIMSTTALKTSLQTSRRIHHETHSRL